MSLILIVAVSLLVIGLLLHVGHIIQKTSIPKWLLGWHIITDVLFIIYYSLLLIMGLGSGVVWFILVAWLAWLLYDIISYKLYNVIYV